MSEKMRCILLTGFGGYDKLSVVERPRPLASDGKVVVEMKACGMNFSDLYTRQGVYTFRGIKPPFVLGLEGAGVISEVGENVSEHKVGDRVVCWNFDYGMWSEFVEVPKSQCFPIPDNMTFPEAACLPVNYLTAYFCIIDFGNLRPGQNVLVQSAAGGVGWAATQLANVVENVTVFGTASSSKHEAIKENGVTYPIDYSSQDFVEEVLKISPSGVNVVLDCLSGSDFTRSQKLLKHMGRLIHIGISNMISGEKKDIFRAFRVWWQVKNFSVLGLVQNNHAICGFNLATLQENSPEKTQMALEQIIKFYNEGKVKPRVDSVWSFDQVVDATKYMVGRKCIGKLILVPQKEES